MRSAFTDSPAPGTPRSVVAPTVLAAAGSVVALLGIIALDSTLLLVPAALTLTTTGSYLATLRWRARHADYPGTSDPLASLLATLEARDAEIASHSRRVARHAVAIARELGLSEERVARIRRAALLHDIGKTFTPKPILDKAGPLSEEEYAVVKRHAEVGARMVGTLEDRELTAIVLHHHERIDGRGYPDGLKGEAIPLGARIVAVADTYDAVTSERPYRRAKPHAEALAMLDALAGDQLDREIVRAFRHHRSRPFLARPRAQTRRTRRGPSTALPIR